MAKLATIVKLGSTMKHPKMPKGEREKTFGPFNSKSGERRASTKKESFEREASKNIIQVVK